MVPPPAIDNLIHPPVPPKTTELLPYLHASTSNMGIILTSTPELLATIRTGYRTETTNDHHLLVHLRGSTTQRSEGTYMYTASQPATALIA